MSNDSGRVSRGVIYSSAFVVAVWVAHILLRRSYEPGHTLRLLATMALIAAFAGVVVAHVRLIRNLDEFQRHVQLLALAIAFGCSLVAMLAIGFLRAEGWFVQNDPRDLAGVMMFFYLFGLVVAWRRYR